MIVQPFAFDMHIIYIRHSSSLAFDSNSFSLVSKYNRHTIHRFIVHPNCILIRLLYPHGLREL
ncbi:hypothetical protein M413DRAFT_85691 [Hebeloma cylindrosporum]|uniref:Uncharacterized protein n=1 Tax=Hebeloma cylindrosporum TaxID=76867 RepID=A0A0C3CX90_HEBCY|nr:hypothetical protein M413DRAFT_85691 [Hebeloma cylindrosporum h7]